MLLHRTAALWDAFVYIKAAIEAGLTLRYAADPQEQLRILVSHPSAIGCSCVGRLNMPSNLLEDTAIGGTDTSRTIAPSAEE